MREYDVALSFAGEDRHYAERLAELLRAEEYSVFYDEYEWAKLWGKDLYVHLSSVYKDQANYCVMFLSKHYAQKMWTNHERQSAQARAFEENREYILPVRLDDTEIPGILPTVGYLDLRSMTIERVYQVLVEKLSTATSQTPRINVSTAAVGESDSGDVVTQQILERTEKRRQSLFRANEPTLTVVICPILSNRPLISTADIYGFAKENGLWGDYSSRVTGGVAGGFVSPIKMDSYSSNYWEFNEYGIVYHSDILVRKKSWITDNAKQFHDCLHFPAFVWTIGNSVDRAQSFYRKCEYFGHIGITAGLQQVSGERLLYYDQYPKEDIERQRSTEPEISASTRYFPRNLEQAEQFVNVIDELVGQILWTFNIDDDQRHEKVADLLRKGGLLNSTTQ